jgi:hypothetical protein
VINKSSTILNFESLIYFDMFFLVTVSITT